MAEDREQTVFQSSKDGQALVSAISRFALELCAEQRKRSEGNLFMSPLSISAVLSMAYLGARGKTLEEMKKALCFDALEDAKVHQAFSDVVFHLKKSSEGSNECTKETDTFQLHLANRLFAEESHKILKEFQTDCTKYYGADIDAVSFKTEPEKAAEKVNSWVSKTTNDKIRNIISPKMIDEDTTLILVNSIYFKSAWKDRFEKDHTEESDFFVTPEEAVKTPLMFQKVQGASYFYSDDLQCQVLKLPYKSGALSMFVLLPDKEKTSLESVEAALTEGHVSGFDGKFQQFPDVRVWLPKFKMEADLELREVLSGLGMKSVFARGVADLSGIDGTDNLYASKVLHKAFVDVNEDGTEAAAATAMKANMLTSCPGGGEEPVTFRADHPFLFFIREEKTKAVLFIGRVVRPEYS
jgi:serine protease inhibitor